MTTDAQKIQNEIIHERDALRKELEMIKTDEVLKETTLNELKKQCSDLIASRCIEVNLSMKKP